MSDKKEVSVIIKALDDTVPGFKSARHHASEFASEAKSLIAEAFAGFTIFEFFKTAVEKATEAEQAYTQLSNTLANVGVDYEKNRHQIDDTIKSLQKVANVRSDEAIKGFNTLVQRSGDYKKSLDNMVLVADLAKAKHLEFNDAAELVGRVMGGNTRVLKQFGIVTKDSADGIAQLKERLHGAAAADLQTFGGQVESLKIKFLNMAEAVGDVITGNSTLGGSLKSVGEWLVNLTASLEKNASQYGFWFSVIIAGVQEVAQQFKDVVIVAFNVGKAIGDVLNLSWGNKGDPEKRKALFADMAAANKNVEKATNDMSQGFDRFGDAVALAGQKAEASVHRTEAQLDAAAAKNRQRLAEREAAEEEARQKKIDAANKVADAEFAKQVASDAKIAQLKDFKDRAIRQLAIDDLTQKEKNTSAELAALREVGAASEDIVRVQERLLAVHEALAKFGIKPTKTFGEQLGDAFDGKTTSGVHEGIESDIERVRSANKKFADELRLTFKSKEKPEFLKHLDEVQDKLEVARVGMEAFGRATQDAMQALVSGSGGAGEAFKRAILNALGAVAAKKGAYYGAEALAALGEGFLTGDPSRFTAAAELGAASLGFYALAGVAGGIASGGGGGSSSSSAFSSSATSSQNAGPVTVVFTGKNMLIDASDPKTQDEFLVMIQKLAGNRQVNFAGTG